MLLFIRDIVKYFSVSIMTGEEKSAMLLPSMMTGETAYKQNAV
jgi:hypothetical protein